MHVSLEVVNQIYVIHEAMNRCKNLKDSIKACFENVNIADSYHATDKCLHDELRVC